MLDINPPLIFSRLIAHLRNPLYRNGYALASSAVLTSAIGMVYWVLAARLYPPDLVGLNSAIISAMMFLGGLAQLNLSNANIRFIPTSGRLTPGLVRVTYLVSLGVAVIVSLVFLSQLRVWTPTLSILESNSFLIATFVIATMAWAIFALEDGVLTGLRQAPFVPVENTLYSIIKVVLMVELIHILPQLGLFFSWVIGLVIVVVPTTYFIFRRLIPKHVEETSNQERPIALSKLSRYIAGDYVGATAWLACVSLMPLLVTQLAGPTANAYYYLSWQVALLFYSITKSLGASMIVESASRPQRLGQYTIRILIQSILITVPMVLILGIGAPIVLRLFGESYAAGGTLLLRILLISAIPYIIISTDVNVARVQQEISRVVVILVSLCVMVLGLSYWLIQRFGVLGAGYAWLGSEILISTGIILTRLPAIRAMFTNQGDHSNKPMHLGPIKVLDPAAHSHQVLTQITHPWRIIENWRRLRRASPLVPALLQQIPSQVGRVSHRTWMVHYIIQTQTDRTVLALGPTAGAALVLAKLPSSHQAASRLERQAEVLTSLNAYPSLNELRALLPIPLARGMIENQPFIIEPILSGLDARLLATQPERMSHILSTAACSISNLHHATLTQRMMNEGEWQLRVAAPIDLVCDAILRLPGGKQYLPAASRLGIELREALIGHSVALSWVHGDFVPDNLLVDPKDDRLTGILDWELAEPDGFPILDILQLLMATRRETQHKELGGLVVDLLRNSSDWSPQEQSVLDSTLEDLPGHVLDIRHLILLFWLQHVAGNLTKSTRYNRHLWWIYSNIRPILQIV